MQINVIIVTETLYYILIKKVLRLFSMAESLSHHVYIYKTVTILFNKTENQIICINLT